MLIYLLATIVHVVLLHAQALNVSATNAVGQLPICAQTCVTLAFQGCDICTLGDFDCVCACSTFNSNVTACLNESCASSNLDSLHAEVQFVCASPALINDPAITSTSSSSITSSTTTSLDLTPTLIPVTTLTTKSPASEASSWSKNWNGTTIGNSTGKVHSSTPTVLPFTGEGAHTVGKTVFEPWTVLAILGIAVSLSTSYPP